MPDNDLQTDYLSMYALDNNFMYYDRDWTGYMLRLSAGGREKIGSFLNILRQACENNPELAEQIEQFWDSAGE